MQAVPTGSLGVPSSGMAGECHSLASMATHLQGRQAGWRQPITRSPGH